MSAVLAALVAWHAFRLVPTLDAVVRDARAPAAVRWRFAADGGISSSPTYADGVVYVDSNARTLSALDYATGRLRWQFSADNDLMSAPLLDGTIAIVSSGDAEPMVWDPPHFIALGAGPSTIYGIDLHTGRELWRVPIARTGMPSGAIVRGTYVHFDGMGTLLALDPRTGALRWRVNLTSTATMSAIEDLGDGTMLVSGGFPNAVYRVRVRDGSLVWSHRFPTCRAAFSDQPVATDGRRVYGGYLRMLDRNPACFGERGEGEQHAYALDLRTGALLWDRRLGRGVVPPRNEAAIPLVADGRLYVGSSVEPVMHALDAATGRVLWERRVRGAVKGGAVTVDGKLYFGDLGGVLWALDARTGAVRGALHERVAFNVGSPIVVNRTLVIGSLQGDVLAVPLAEILRARLAP
ncbi:MAG: PQQ-binding-like beta-propeller repeat protein [bacterium]|nr:PQQ-binding-like beta-propeller repeat protein [bacterium]